MGTSDVMGNLLHPQVIPASWTVGVEMMYWIFMPFIILYKPLRHLLFLVALIGTLTISVWEIGGESQWYRVRYYGCLAGVLPFLVGMYLYDFKGTRLSKATHVLMPFMIVLYLCCLMYGWGGHFSAMRMQGIYLNTLLGGAILYYLSHIDLKAISPAWHNADRFLGNLAYGVLLFHQPVAALIVGYSGIRHRTNLLFYTAYPFTLAAAMLGYMYIEKPMEAVRAKFRSE
jgi:peptidoglycan/LPS O-acetylase OafA/YrhL